MKKHTPNPTWSQRVRLSLSFSLLASIAPATIAATMSAESGVSTPAKLTAVNDDDRFHALRDAALNEDHAAAQNYAKQLSNFDIPAYVEYYALRSRLRSVQANDVYEFLRKYDNLAIADRLRNDWLLVLGLRGDWANFDRLLPQFVLADDSQVKCYSMLSKAVRNNKVGSEARQFLKSPKQYADGCYSLVTYLYQQKQWSETELWEQLRVAAESSALPLAKRLGKLLNIPEKRMIEVMEKPQNYLKKATYNDQTARHLLIMAIARLAKKDADLAVQQLERYQAHLNREELGLAWAQIAMPVAQKLHVDANHYWKKTEGVNLSNEAYQWRVRSALRELNWPAVKNAILAMPTSLQTEPTWVYWYARALMHEGKKDEAFALFSSISEQHHFYGQLALEERGQKIGVPEQAKAVTAEEIAPMAKNPHLQRAIRFYAMNLRFEGTREWNWALRGMNERELIVAAEFARQNNLLDRMVNTSDRTKSEHDFNQRFPTPFNENMYKSTKALGLDMAWVYGLIRQESRFIMHAKSHVGASGLMQVMPQTARYVAKKIGLNDFVPEQVNDIATNITLGTSYLNMVLTDLGGSQALASAAYNAGPGRPRAWRASLTRTVEGAIFAETIPFSETRGYVKNVLSNATYYAAIFEKKPQSLKARLGAVTPRGAAGDSGE
jgi:soluble lytic murein transglycosylase